LNAFWVTAVLSGDKIRLTDGNLIHYYGIQAPSPKDDYFEISRNANAHLVGISLKEESSQVYSKRRVLVKFVFPKPDDQGTYQAYVHYPVSYDPEKGIVFRFVNQELLAFGYAIVDPNVDDHTYAKEFLEAQEIAKQKRLGLWGSRK